MMQFNTSALNLKIFSPFRSKTYEFIFLAMVLKYPMRTTFKRCNRKHYWLLVWPMKLLLQVKSMEKVENRWEMVRKSPYIQICFTSLKISKNIEKVLKFWLSQKIQKMLKKGESQKSWKVYKWRNTQLSNCSEDVEKYWKGVKCWYMVKKLNNKYSQTCGAVLVYSASILVWGMVINALSSLSIS